jgi:hypothetical protein
VNFVSCDDEDAWRGRFAHKQAADGLLVDRWEVCWLIVGKSRRVCCLSFAFRGAPVTLFTRQMHAAVCEFAAVIFVQTKPPVTLSGKMLQSHNLTALLFFFAFESSL